MKIEKFQYSELALNSYHEELSLIFHQIRTVSYQAKYKLKSGGELLEQVDDYLDSIFDIVDNVRDISFIDTYHANHKYEESENIEEYLAELDTISTRIESIIELAGNKDSKIGQMPIIFVLERMKNEIELYIEKNTITDKKSSY